MNSHRVGSFPSVCRTQTHLNHKYHESYQLRIHQVQSTNKPEKLIITMRSDQTQDPKPWVARAGWDFCCDFFGNLVSVVFRIVFRCLFGSILAPVSVPTWLPKSTKIQEKSMPRCHPSWTPFFYRFLSIFASDFYPPKPTKR